MRMARIRPVLVVHGGAGNHRYNEDGCSAAARRGLERLRAGEDALAAAVAAVVAMEDDPRFNAGTGAMLRSDGATIETDASVMDSSGRLGAVCCLRDVRNPVLVARQVVETPHWMLAGPGAVDFARAQGFGPHRLEPAADALPPGAAGEPAPAGRHETDTVGAVVLDGRGLFAVASSTGGSAPAMVGRVGDTPIPGCGYWAGPHGAVAATGVGEQIVARLLARVVYEWIERGMPLQQALERGVALFPASCAVGLIGVTRHEAAAASNREMPFHVLCDDEGAGD
ncbi:isoaspartyl peptidase/L-asparaginase [Caldimonas tepidiphila]|uniref:isoaspartyl peptidase/L-asparaginase n=1 Tax=Caldimonas tepidiphila TaxID=2315841 RepID=UPI0014734A72|nr:isoaspartyl peptidase/L-asparaginase [Caldimonas tepidiphila]